MKIFAVYLSIDLTKKPDWLDDFRKQNNAWFGLHITLIQPRFIEDDQIDHLKARISDFLKKERLTSTDKRLSFDKIVFEETAGRKYLFMWFTKENAMLMRLQKDLVSLLKDYDKYTDGSTKEYEMDFRPHITIAEDIDANKKFEVEKLLSSSVACEGIINNLALPIVKDTSKEERENAENITLYQL